MGLDLTAFSNVAVLPISTERETDWDTSINAFAYAPFTASTRGLVDHDVLTEPDWAGHTLIAVRDYDITESRRFSWRGGSYLGHGIFRGALAQLTGWDLDRKNPTASADQPFYELVWFADNEGCIGHLAAADLLQDFREHQAAFIGAHKDEPWMVDAYHDWTKGLELAADHGLVYFH